MSQNDISDLSSSSVNQGGALLLPIRSEKIVLSATSTDTDTADYHITAALQPYSNYVTVRLPGRGGPTPGVFAPGTSSVYRFRINPSEVHIQRQTLDQQTMTRKGWQIGVWGEDFITITLNGKTPGRYFTDGLTDFYTPFTQSYRNLTALELLFENNGYWYEGEQVSSQLGQTTRRIKAHQDVELTVGEFIWSGMFESMDTTEDADSPFLVDFTLNFVAWRERFVRNTPYPDSIGGEVQRGHVQPTYLLANVIAANSASDTPIQTSNATLTALIMDPEQGGFTQS